MTWLFGLFGGAIIRWLIGGAAIATVMGVMWAWHSSNFVSKAELKNLQKLNTELLKASENKDRLGIQAEKERLDAEQKIDEMEKENDRLNEEDRKGDDPVLLDSDDLKRLRGQR